MAYLSLDTNPAQQGLAQMLVNLQQQGAAQTARTGPMIGDALTQMLLGFQRKGEQERERGFAAEQSKENRQFATNRDIVRAREEQAQIAEQDARARGRAEVEHGYRMEEQTAADKAAQSRAETAVGGKRTGAERWAELLGKGAAQVGDWGVKLKAMQMQAAQNAEKNAIERDKIAATKQIAADRLASDAARLAIARNDRAGATEIANAGRVVQALRYRHSVAMRALDKATFGGIVAAPPDKQAAAEEADRQLTEAEGRLFSLATKQGLNVSDIMGGQQPPTAQGTTPEGVTDDDILNAIAGGG